MDHLKAVIVFVVGLAVGFLAGGQAHAQGAVAGAKFGAGFGCPSPAAWQMKNGVATCTTSTPSGDSSGSGSTTPTTAQSVSLPWHYGSASSAYTVKLCTDVRGSCRYGAAKQLTGTFTLTWYPASLGRCSSFSGAKVSNYVYGCFVQSSITWDNLDYNKALYYDSSRDATDLYAYTSVNVDANCGTYYITSRTTVTYTVSGKTYSSIVDSGYNSALYDVPYSDFANIASGYKTPVLWNAGCGGS